MLCTIYVYIDTTKEMYKVRTEYTCTHQEGDVGFVARVYSVTHRRVYTRVHCFADASSMLFILTRNSPVAGYMKI